MADENRCAQCGAMLTPDAPQGLCPACLMKRGLESATFPAEAAAGYVPPTPAELAPFFPDLEILELVGRGGMGVVYKARQKALDRLVALKILSPKIGPDPAFAERFQREARAMALLSHPHIVAIYDFGQAASALAASGGVAGGEGGAEVSPLPSDGRGAGGEGDVDNERARRPHPSPLPEGEGTQSLPSPACGRGAGGEGGAEVSPRPSDGRGAGGEGGPAAPLYYFLMEFIDGASLRRLLDAGKLSPEEALAIVPQICEALQFAHDQGVVHRDIKPENILLDKRGQVKIADFGLAKLMGREAKDFGFSLTGVGQVMGTPHYMAPEQLEHPQAVDHRADIYSLGVVFYQMLTGELPLGRFAPPSRKVQIDVRLDQVVLRALEKEPQLRYQHASEVKTEVETIVGDAGSARGARLEASQAGPGAGAPVALGPVTDDGAIERARLQVQGPAIGLLVVGILNLAMLALCLGWSVETPKGSQRIVASPQGSASIAMLPMLFAILACSVSIVLAGLKMRRLKSYGSAITGSILAMLFSPACPIGLPIGIWALIVLSRGEVRSAFAREKGAASTGAPLAGAWQGEGRSRRWSTLARVLAVAGIPASVLLGELLGWRWSGIFLLALCIETVALLLGIAGRGFRGKLGLVVVSIRRPGVVVVSILLIMIGLVVYRGGFLPEGARGATVVNVGQFPHGPWIGRLPSGITVELVGSGDYAGRWCRPDGSPLPEAPYEPISKFHSSCNVTRCFFARLGNLPAQPIGMNSAVSPSSGGTAVNREVMQHGHRVVDSRSFLAFQWGVPREAQTVTVRCGISAGAWQGIAEISYDDPVPQAVSHTYGRGGLGDLTEIKDGVSVVAWSDLVDEDEVRVIAVCDDRKEVLARLRTERSESEEPPGEAMPQRIDMATFQGLSLKQIKQIKLQHRPYQWVEFRNVAVKPKP